MPKVPSQSDVSCPAGTILELPPPPLLPLGLPTDLETDGKGVGGVGDLIFLAPKSVDDDNLDPPTPLLPLARDDDILSIKTVSHLFICQRTLLGAKCQRGLKSGAFRFV